MLFEGTNIVKNKGIKNNLIEGIWFFTKYYIDRNCVIALVTRTGFSTVRGSLIRDIIFPKPI